MNCPKCGAPADEGKKFCKVCGAKLNEIENDTKQPVSCPKCGAALSENSAICPVCGLPLEANSQDKPNGYESIGSQGITQSSIKPAAPYTGTSADLKTAFYILLNIFFIFVGAFFIVKGLELANTASSLRNVSFGADFYTYTYKGIIEIAETLVDIQRALGYCLTAIGTAMEAYIILKLCHSK